MVDVTDEDRAAADTLAHQICGCATTAQHNADMAAILAYGEARYRKGVEDAARVVEIGMYNAGFRAQPVLVEAIRKLAPTPPARPE